MIRNKGKIIPQDIILMGSSTKRGDDTKIGQFGSGSKFSLSWLLRNGCTPSIFSGRDAIEISTRMTEHRGHPRDVIYVAGENTNITTELGLKWTCWMALRELISNAIDEGEEKVDIVYVRNEGFNQFLDDESTTIFIPLNEETKPVMSNYDHFFCFDRQPDWIGQEGMIYIKSEKSAVNIYRKGIRCYDSANETLIDFNFNHIPITEDRLIEGGEGTFDTYAKNVLDTVDDVNVIKAAILSDYKDMMRDYRILPSLWVEAYRQLINEGHRFTTRTMKNILGVITDGQEIHGNHFQSLIDNNLISNPLESVFQNLDFMFHRMDGPSAEVEAVLKQFGDFKVYFGKMDTYKNVKIKENEIFIIHSLATKPIMEIASICIKEHPKATKYITQLLNK